MKLVVCSKNSLVGLMAREFTVNGRGTGVALIAKSGPSITNECTTDCGENVGGSSNPAPAQADSDDGGDGDGDPDSEPPHRTRKPRSTPRAAASCGTADLGDPLAFSVAEFCEKHRITKPHLYELFKRGTGPRIMKVGRRTLISIEAAADWRRQMEQGAQLSRRCA